MKYGFVVNFEITIIGFYCWTMVSCFWTISLCSFFIII